MFKYLNMKRRILVKTLKSAGNNINQVIYSISPLENKITAYWYRGTLNFGDLITPLLLKKYGFTTFYAPIEQAQVLSTGSILDLVPENYSGHIVGSGLIKNTVLHFKKATIWAVRGELTRQRIDAPKNVALGDPGLLSYKLIKKRQDKSYTLGIIPHYVDKKDVRISMIHKKHKSDILLIDVMRKPSAVFRDIDKCEFILSSSLHGLIVADSLGIPNAWIALSDKIIGKGFKFYDYYSAIGKRKNLPYFLNGTESLTQLLKQTNKPPNTLEEVKEGLNNTFRALKIFFLSEQL
jgi:pyruvyltransferase